MVKLTFWHYFIEKQVMPIYKIRNWVCLCLICSKLLGKATTWLCGIFQKVFSIQNFYCYPSLILPWLKSQNSFNKKLLNIHKIAKIKVLVFSETPFTTKTYTIIKYFTNPSKQSYQTKQRIQDKTKTNETQVYGQRCWDPKLNSTASGLVFMFSTFHSEQILQVHIVSRLCCSVPLEQYLVANNINFKICQKIGFECPKRF